MKKYLIYAAILLCTVVALLWFLRTWLVIRALALAAVLWAMRKRK